jgi:CHAT domain-containing protein
MPSTPGEYQPLNVAEEVAAIENHSRRAASIKHLSRPTRGDVLNALKFCAIAHLACHGSADRIEPSKSALIVRRETEERLTVEDLDTITYSSAKLAYLSACSTAEIQVSDLVEESVHLASIFQLTGFQHVIGTLWGADDNAAVKIASKFYEGLLQHGDVRDSSVAQALHHAVLCLRNTGDNHTAISLWAPFIHLGY